MSINLQKYSIILLILLTGIFFGCQKNKVNTDFRVVTGTVFLNDSPIDGAQITFFPLDNSGVPAAGFTNAQGQYSLTAVNSLVGGTGTKPGKYRVTVIKNMNIVDKDQQDFEAGRITSEEYENRLFSKPPNTEKPKSLVPIIYTNSTQSPLEVTVEDKKENVIDLKLEEQ
ncbi:MAG: carboxypeptidase-like regulatory domain-containing protein [Planctomycetaceae bacterium]|jgi:hypothetical protein|nr:carboxypeptidase-like regulatory domain-containing protein [Planctomycetaceae bacterium]